MLSLKRFHSSGCYPAAPTAMHNRHSKSSGDESNQVSVSNWLLRTENVPGECRHCQDRRLSPPRAGSHQPLPGHNAAIFRPTPEPLRHHCTVPCHQPLTGTTLPSAGRHRNLSATPSDETADNKRHLLHFIHGTRVTQLKHRTHMVSCWPLNSPLGALTLRHCRSRPAEPVIRAATVRLSDTRQGCAH